jgi:8-oxo-dGTP diphosphatase
MFEPELSIQVEAVIAPLCIQKGVLKVLIVKRAISPNEGEWAFPSGLLEYHETFEQAAERLLEHITGLAGGTLKQVQCFSALNRYAEHRVIAQLFSAYFKPSLSANLLVTWQASEAEWVPFSDERLSGLAFDHSGMVAELLKAVQIDTKLGSAVFELLPTKFTLTNLQQGFETILGITLDKRNFRKRTENAVFLKHLNEIKTGQHSDARLFSLNKEALKEHYLNHLKPLL